MTIISRKVWRKGWRKEAAKTQVASRRFANLLDYMEQTGLSNLAAGLRRWAMENGVCQAETAFLDAVKTVEKTVDPPHRSQR